VRNAPIRRSCRALPSNTASVATRSKLFASEDALDLVRLIIAVSTSRTLLPLRRMLRAGAR
jgi:hypothetical protein